MRTPFYPAVALSLLLVGPSLLAGCGAAEGGSPALSSSCMKDIDCKGDRLCVSAQCVDPHAEGDSQAPSGSGPTTTGASAGGGTEPTSADSLSCSGSKEKSCLAIEPRGETTVDRISLQSGTSYESSGWILFSGSGIFSFYFLRDLATGDYEVEPYSADEIRSDNFAGVPLGIHSVRGDLLDPAHSSKDHYLMTSGTVHLQVDLPLVIADWDGIEVRSAERVSAFVGGRSKGHIVRQAPKILSTGDAGAD